MTSSAQDPSNNPCYIYFSDQERHMLIDNPIELTAPQKDILRLLIEDILNAQKKTPTNPEPPTTTP